MKWLSGKVHDFLLDAFEGMVEVGVPCVGGGGRGDRREMMNERNLLECEIGSYNITHA